MREEEGVLNGYVDIHSHVLPGIDDGAKDEASSIAMLRRAAEEGTTDIIATPHQHPGRYPNEADAIRRALHSARAFLEPLGSAVPRVHLGAEVHLDADLSARVTEGARLRLASGPYLLLELSDVFSQESVASLLYDLQLAGTVPVLAHPERIGQLLRHPEQMRRFVELGALGQATGSSIAGDFGPPCRDVTAGWMKEGLLHLVASDAHDPIRRHAGLRRAHAAVVALMGEEIARLMFCERPRAILEGRALEVPPPEEPGASRSTGWRDRLRGLLGRETRRN